MRLAALAALVGARRARGVPAQAAEGPIEITRVQVSGEGVLLRALAAARCVAGPAIVQLVNFGEDPHDMRIRRVGGTHTYRTPLVQPGAYFDLELKLQPGRYKLWCSIANHEALGMKAMLTVRAA